MPIEVKKAEPVDPPILFLVMRSDLASMNTGKFGAQTSHGSNAAVKHTRPHFFDMVVEWEQQTADGFGTAITLDGGSWYEILDLENELAARFGYEEYMAGHIFDPSYPVTDGKVTHLIPLDTGLWVFCRSNSKVRETLKRLNLYP